MIFVKLRIAMENYERSTGERMTYEILADKTGLARATLESIASRKSYNTRLSTIDRLCEALNCQPGDLLEYVSDAEVEAHED